MYLQTEEQLVNLEILDNRQMTLCTIPATLLNLHGEWACVLVAAEENPSGLRWGAWVRFWIGNGTNSYEVIGSVSALELQRESLEEACSIPHQKQSREVMIRLNEFKPVNQRRHTPRHFRQAKILFKPDSKTVDHLNNFPETYPKFGEPGYEWISGMCIDVGPGGMRIRTSSAAQQNEYLLLCLTFPEQKTESNIEKSQFLLPCRVIRCSPCIRNSTAVEIAVKFECLSVDDGIALSNWISKK